MKIHKFTALQENKRKNIYPLVDNFLQQKRTNLFFLIALFRHLRSFWLNFALVYLSSSFLLKRKGRKMSRCKSSAKKNRPRILNHFFGSLVFSFYSVRVFSLSYLLSYLGCMTIILFPKQWVAALHATDHIRYVPLPEYDICKLV